LVAPPGPVRLRSGAADCGQFALSQAGGVARRNRAAIRPDATKADPIAVTPAGPEAAACRHVYDHHRSLRLGARLDHGKACSSWAVRACTPLAAGLGRLGAQPPPVSTGSWAVAPPPAGPAAGRRRAARSLALAPGRSQKAWTCLRFSLDFHSVFGVLAKVPRI
jgi:hypothetical protein